MDNQNMAEEVIEVKNQNLAEEAGEPAENLSEEVRDAVEHQYPQQYYELQKSIKNGANWFYWITGLSIINTILLLIGSDTYFVAGLIITQIISAITYGISAEIPELTQVLVIGSIVISVIIAGIFALFGLFANRRHNWCFIIGMILYFLDTIVALLLEDYISTAFHAIALYGIVMGLVANKKLSKLEESMQNNELSTASVSVAE